MYAHMHTTMVRALQAERRAAVERSAGLRTARAAPVGDALARPVLPAPTAACDPHDDAPVTRRAA
ncbi:MAG: hypothetical protein KQH83_01695 [Actinobacteria bacterium]|nr:hypothetical protein [Actinomycetota bacterium]